MGFADEGGKPGNAFPPNPGAALQKESSLPCVGVGEADVTREHLPHPAGILLPAGLEPSDERREVGLLGFRQAGELGRLLWAVVEHGRWRYAGEPVPARGRTRGRVGIRIQIRDREA